MRFFRNVLIIFALLPIVSCEQYDYTSPLPGILEVRLQVVNNRQALIPFGSLNYFGLTLLELEARGPGGSRLPILADLRAIRRNPDGDLFNCLDTLARDGALILGQTYSPPTTFTELYMGISPDPVLFAWYGFYGSQIEVARGSENFLIYGQVPDIPIEEHRVTRVTIALDLDSSLVRRTETFEYRPYFYVSSVNIY